MKYALLSDIHGNLEALEAVLEDLEPQAVDRVVVLGDTIGYGPDPRRCLKRIQGLANLLLIGNHEKSVLVPAAEMMNQAAELLRWTATQLDDLPVWEALAEMIRAGEADTMAHQLQDELEFVHGSPAQPTEQYIWPGQESQYLARNQEIDQRLAQYLDQFSAPHGFCGHTHVPAVLTDYENHPIFEPQRGRLVREPRFTFIGPTTVFFVPAQPGRIDHLHGCRAVINPGSVGQPRALGDPAASYAIYDGDSVTFRRVEYDLARTREKLGKLPVAEETRQFYGERLARGR